MPSPLRNELPRAAPERDGIASTAILQFVEALEREIHEVHSFMLLRHGSVIAEGWWSPYGREHPHLLFSLSKSFTSTAVGLAVTEKRISLDDLVLSFFPDDGPAQVSEHLAAMRVRHLLSMSTGQAVDTWLHMVNRPDGNWIKGFFEVPVLYTPGTHFVYNTGATYMLSAIVQKATGSKLRDYLEPRLFEPLGVEDASWQESPQGITAGGIGLSLKTEDIARFGQLYLNKGKWQTRQLLPEAWIEQATSSRMPNSSGMHIDWRQGYGYQFWRCRHGAYRGDGVFGQYCIVLPDQDAVIAITGGMDVFDMQKPLDLIWELLLPAMRPDALPADVAAEAVLAKKLSDLSLKLVQGQRNSPLASQISGRSYVVDANVLMLDTITLSFSASSCMVRVRTAAGEEMIPCGYGLWKYSQSGLFGRTLLFDRTPMAVSGAWTAEDTFTVVMRLYETPFFYSLGCHFAGDEMMVEVRVNVSLESVQPILLTARSR